MTTITSLTVARQNLGSLPVSTEPVTRVEAALVPDATLEQRVTALLAVAELADEIDPGPEADGGELRKSWDNADALRIVARALAPHLSQHGFDNAYDGLTVAGRELASLRRQQSGQEPAPRYLPREDGSVQESLAAAVDMWEGELRQIATYMAGDRTITTTTERDDT